MIKAGKTDIYFLFAQSDIYESLRLILLFTGGFHRVYNELNELKYLKESKRMDLED